MKATVALLFLLLSSIMYAQSPKKLIVLSRITVDEVLKNNKVAFSIADSYISYSFDTSCQCFVADTFFSSAYRDLFNDSIHGVLKRSSRKIKHTFTLATFNKLREELNKSDSIKTFAIHTSHYYEDIDVWLIQGIDTTHFFKRRGNAPWQFDSMANPSGKQINKIIYSLLPPDFLLRYSLKTAEDRNISLKFERHYFGKFFRKYWRKGKVLEIKKRSL